MPAVLGLILYFASLWPPPGPSPQALGLLIVRIDYHKYSSATTYD